MNKTELKKALKNRSVREAAEILGVSSSTVYRRAKQFKVSLRSKSQAQKDHIKNCGHQRKGTTHDDNARERIAEGSSEFWDSPEGKKLRKKIGLKKKKEWAKKSPKEKLAIIENLHHADRPKNGELSKLGQSVRDIFEKKGYNVEEEFSTFPKHTTDLLLTIGDRKVAIEFVGAMNYGGYKTREFINFYEKLAIRLEQAGYQAVFVIDMGKYVSHKTLITLYSRIIKQLSRQTKSFILRS